jgi:hypothetical protein
MLTMTTEVKQASLIPWVLVAVLAFMVWQRTPKTDVDNSNPEAVAKKMMQDTALGYANEFSKAAMQVQDKEITNEEQLHKQLKERLDEVRSAASVDLNSLLDDRIPTEFDDGNRGAVTTFLESVANGFQ